MLATFRIEVFQAQTIQSFVLSYPASQIGHGVIGGGNTAYRACAGAIGRARHAMNDTLFPALRTRRFLPWLGLSVAAVLLLSAYGLGRYVGDERRTVEPALQAMKAQIQAERQELVRLNEAHQREVDALAARVAELQASATRLDALGERLVRMGQLDPAEFSFGEPAARGGPEGGIGSGDTPSLNPGSEHQLGQVVDDLIAVDQRLSRQQTQLQVLESLLTNRRLAQEATPAGWPVSQGWISSVYGQRTDPFTGQKATHAGVDFAGVEGAEVVSVASGLVTYAGERSGYGYAVDVDHGNGYLTRYAHNRELLVEVGQRVEAGQVIAKMGSSGRSTGPHVHFEVRRDGRPIDPSRMLRDLRG